MDDPQFYKPEHSIFMGVTTKFKLQKLLNDGDISERQHSRVFKAAQAYFKDSLSYILTKFPLSNELIMKAGWIDVGSRIDSKWESVEFFINRLKAIFQQLPVDKFYDEFCDYQTLPDECFRDDVLKLKLLTEKRMERCFFSTEWMSCGGILLSLSSPAQLLNDSNICQ